MIRVRHLIGKQDLLSWIDREDIVKVQLVSKNNRELKNNEICEIYVFYKIENSIIGINTILGACQATINDDTKDKFLTDSDHAFLNGIQSSKAVGFLSKSKVEKLLNIEKKYKINLSISKEIKDIVKNNLILNKNEKF